MARPHHLSSFHFYLSPYFSMYITFHDDNAVYWLDAHVCPTLGNISPLGNSYYSHESQERLLCMYM